MHLVIGPTSMLPTLMFTLSRHAYVPLFLLPSSLPNFKGTCHNGTSSKSTLLSEYLSYSTTHPPTLSQRSPRTSSSPPTPSPPLPVYSGHAHLGRAADVVVAFARAGSSIGITIRIRYMSLCIARRTHMCILLHLKSFIQSIVIVRAEWSSIPFYLK